MASVINACMTLAVMQRGRTRPPESLAQGDVGCTPCKPRLSSTDAFIVVLDTSGQLCPPVGRPAERAAPSRQDELREQMSGMRCGAYRISLSAIEERYARHAVSSFHSPAATVGLMNPFSYAGAPLVPLMKPSLFKRTAATLPQRHPSARPDER